MLDFEKKMEVPTQELELKDNLVRLFVRREDTIHRFVSGNKFRKLKYNLAVAKKEKFGKLLTFGGAYSNHIAAVAYAGLEGKFETIGVIRGEELEGKWQENATLQFAASCGMQFEFVSREEYRKKSDVDFLEKMKLKYGSFYTIPEGGTNELAVRGCMEILTCDDVEYDYIAVSVGTGGTICGLINGSFENQKIIGFPALKGDFLTKEISNFAKKNNWELNSDYTFGGYGRVSNELIDFMNWFYSTNGILLDPIYTGKMLYGIYDLIDKNYFEKGSKILLIHTGGLQGIEGMNEKLERKKATKIKIND